MNYRHAYHAGNFADVAKHVALVVVLEHLKKKSKGFVVIDTHAGRGLYDLSGVEATRTCEAEAGIGLIRDLKGPLPAALETYLELVRTTGASAYPGSPLIAARLLRAQDRLVAIEKHPEEAAVLTEVLRPFAQARVLHADGYARLATLLPPQERRGVVLLDPPFEQAEEFRAVAAAVTAAMRRFATGTYMVWYPIKSAARATSFCGELLAGGANSALRVEISSDAPGEGMRMAGLVVINPPFGFAEQMVAVGEYLRVPLAARLTVSWLSGGS
ncbi:MAG: 23S rRNA (adenine(2030)-N(6))-methyltransferase RlmJ [Alphaproteobacteria bacterium]|nr:23S rRNA (adenine(2030)-N(6))-methyltransferase RlmJ [Alphaproteobacteria bacterium]